MKLYSDISVILGVGAGGGGCKKWWGGGEGAETEEERESMGHSNLHQSGNLSNVNFRLNVYLIVLLGDCDNLAFTLP